VHGVVEKALDVWLSSGSSQELIDNEVTTQVPEIESSPPHDVNSSAPKRANKSKFYIVVILICL